MKRLNRRELISASACGFGGIATASLFSRRASGADALAAGDLHHPAKAKRVIFLFMQGGVSQVDSFDHKPALKDHDGTSFAFNDARTIAKTGKLSTQHRLMNSPWKFKPYGESGKHVSELFPETARHVDDLCFLHAMHTEGVAHGPATLFLHCGATNFIRPSVGSWVLYGLGRENESLPGFVSISPSIGNGGPRNYGSAFLPAEFQGTRIGNADSRKLVLDSLTRDDIDRAQQAEQLKLLASLNATQFSARDFQSDELTAAMDSYDLSRRMQDVAPEVMDLESETNETLDMYGINSPETDVYGRRCLLARRLCESGVRFIQVNYGDNSANPAWDQHSNLPKHATHAKAVDKPIAGLLTDLKRRGLLEDTIVWWGGEFGRTPYAQSNGTGRDHNPGGFTVWLAGGGFKPGHSHGETDEFGFQGINGKVHMHDLHATILHQLGLDHKQLTFEHAGRNFRLTDVHGRVVDSVIA